MKAILIAVVSLFIVSVALASAPPYVPGAATVPYSPANTANWSPVPNAVNTALDTLAANAAGGVTLAGDTTGPSGSNTTTGLHNVVNWQGATLDNGSTLSGGAASPPPANPQTYVTITINGSTLFIPAYHKGS